MKIVMAFDAFKGCMSAAEACHVAARAAQEILPDATITECPLSDGGEGLVDCVEQFYSSRKDTLSSVQRVHLPVHGPLRKQVEASYIVVQNHVDPSVPIQLTAYMEMASASGLTLVPEEQRNPMQATTYGVGEMLLDAIQRGCQDIVLGIGGSATCDAGQGMLDCLKEHGWSLPDDRLPVLTVACDVNAPLYGPQGAAVIFAPQKGATPEQVALLDKQLRTFAQKTEEAGLATTSQAFAPGAGAAGGLGYALMVYLKASLKPGIDIILDRCGFDVLLDDADIVITGEGKSDAQTLMGKVPQGVASRCRKRVVPVWLFSGSIEDKELLSAHYFHRVMSINEDDPRSLTTLLQPSVAKENLRRAVKRALLSM